LATAASRSRPASAWADTDRKGYGAEEDDLAERGDGGETRAVRSAADGVEYDVGAATGSRGAHPLGEVVAAAQWLGPEAAHDRGLLVGRHGAKDKGADPPGELDRELADAARGGVKEHDVAGAHIGDEVNEPPGGKALDGDSGQVANGTESGKCSSSSTATVASSA